jgi:hypothetical protein
VSIGSKVRMALAGWTAVALIGGVMAAGPADAGKKKKHGKAKHAKVVQVSKGGNAQAGNGGAGGAGGSSGSVNNTGNVVGGVGSASAGPGTGPGAGLPADLVACVNNALADGVLDALESARCGALVPPNAEELFPAFIECLEQIPNPVPPVPAQFIAPCLIGSGPGGGGAGGNGGSGGNATGGNAGNNSNSSSVTVTRNDHSIGVGG